MRNAVLPASLALAVGVSAAFVHPMAAVALVLGTPFSPELAAQWNDPEMLVGVFVIPLAVQWWSVWYPGSEPGGGGYVAQRMLHGELPYRDIFDQKPPGVFVAYLLAFGVFGPTGDIQGDTVHQAMVTIVEFAQRCLIFLDYQID